MWIVVRLSFVILFLFSAIDAEQVLLGVANGTIEEPILRIRSLPTTVQVVEKNWTTLSDALDIFSARNLIKNWNEDKYVSVVGADCGKDITTYVKALQNEELWALKGKAESFYLMYCAI